MREPTPSSSAGRASDPDLARRSGQIVSIAAHVVRENDEFEFEYGLDPKLRHVPGGEGAGEITHAYAVAHLKDGGNAFEVMTLGEIHLVMLQTQSKGNWGPWKDHFPEMARKTAIRRLSKFLPLSIEFATAIALDAKATDQGEQHLEDVLTGDFTVIDDAAGQPAESSTDALKDRLRNQDPEQGLEATGMLVDAQGTRFDPDFHVANTETGEPVMNKDKTFRLRPGKAQAAAEAHEQSGEQQEGELL